MVLDEIGVSPHSERYFSTPSSFAEQIFFYVTRAGHYYANKQYYFSSQSILAQEPTHNRHFCMVFVKEGSLQALLDRQELTASAGTVFLYDCRRPHCYHSLSDQTELLWMCFDGMSAAEMIRRLISVKPFVQPHDPGIIAALSAKRLPEAKHFSPALKYHLVKLPAGRLKRYG